MVITAVLSSLDSIVAVAENSVTYLRIPLSLVGLKTRFVSLPGYACTVSPWDSVSIGNPSSSKD